MALIEVLSPRAPVQAQGKPPAERPRSLDGLTIGLLNNNKPNADVLQSHLVQLLERRFHLKGVVWKRKPGPSLPAEGLEDWARECDVVVNASGD